MISMNSSGKIMFAVFASCAMTVASAQAQNFPAEQVKFGADTYARHCSACHGARMKNPEGAYDLPTFPKDQKSRFVYSVSKGKTACPHGKAC